MADEPRIVFNSSLPRSGSTLLQNILAQNPRFYCSPTSGVVALLYAARVQFAEFPAFKAQDRELMQAGFRGFCRQGLVGFYAAVTDRPVCVDKSRTWMFYREWLDWFYPDPKVLVCVRDLRAILSSMEKRFRKTRHTDAGGREADPSKGMNMMTVGNRVAHWMNANPLGPGVLGLVDLVHRGLIKHFHVIRFEDLTANPKATMVKVYDYLGEPPFEHDFERVEQVTQEDDAEYDIYADHTIRPQVRPVPLDYEQVLGRDLCTQVVRSFPAFYSAFYPGVR